MKKATGKILVAAMSLIIAVAVATGTTFAWFSMNNVVRVTGMAVNTQVSNNLWIAPVTAAADEGNNESNYNIALNQQVGGLLEPVSTINGFNFFYTPANNVNTNGSAKAATYTEYNPADTTGFNTTYTTSGAVGYVDYSFYIRVTNAGDTNEGLNMTVCNLLYDGVALDSKDDAWRVAVFAKSATKNTAAGAIADTDLVTILKTSDAAYFNDTAVSATNAKSSVSTKIDDAATIATINAGATAYYKVIVRLWLEGEDTSCNNTTYADLSKKYTLDLKFELGNTAVAVIGSTANAVATGDTTVTATVTLSGTTTGTIANGEAAASFKWINAATGAEISGATGYTYTNEGAAVKVYCVVTTEKGNTYRTNTVSLAAAS